MNIRSGQVNGNDRASLAAKFGPMPKKIYEWRIIRIRAKGEFLGYVEAPDEKAAIEAAAKEFGIAPELQKRLLAQGRG